jgi:DNA polymerase-3 subunit alpha
MTVNNFFSDIEDYKLNLHGVRLPTFEIQSSEKDHAKVDEDCSNLDFLKALCRNGFRKLGLKKGSKEFKSYGDRANRELKTLEELGFIDYVLLVWKVINFCEKEEIPTGPGRGSAAGSLVLYLIGVTKVDPVKYGLFFERFVSKIRAKKKEVDGITYLDGSLMCDVDLDICYYKRSKVIEFLEEEFKGKTSKILTLSTLSGKILIKDCGKTIAGKSETEMNQVSNMIPKVFGQVQDLNTAYEEVEELKEWCDENKDVYDIALKLRGLIRNKGVHASGMLLSHSPLDESCPIELSSDKSIVSAFDMNWASLLNVKLDLLGLRSVTVVDDVCKMVGIKMDDIDVSDPIIYQNLFDLRTPHGLFQIEADTNFRVCQKVKPKNIEELSAVLALARPGALAFVDQYSNYSNNGTYDAIHPFFDDILSTTGGVCLYQEQMMQMAHKVGFTLDEAEILRRIVGKKKVSEVRKWKKKIKDKIVESKLDPDIGKILWKVLEDSANYSFNKSHSIAYATLSAMTVYLKFKYPKEFFLALLKMSRFEPDPIAEISKIHKELYDFDVELLPPHLVKSEMNFSIEGDNIRFGLLSIKGISDKSIEKIINFKNKYSNKFEIFQAAEEAKIPIGILSSLIQAGALEGFKQSRSQVVLEAQLWKLLTVREKRFVAVMGEEHDYDLPSILRKLTNFKDEKNKVVIKESRRNTIRKKYSPYLKIYKQNSKNEKFANWYYEKTYLGYTHDVTLMEIFIDKQPKLEELRTIRDLPVDFSVYFVGTVLEDFKGISKKGNAYLRLQVQDNTGVMTVLMFEKQMASCEEINGGKLPSKGNIVIVRGIKKEDAIFANVIGIEDQSVYTKLSEIPNDIKNSSDEEIDFMLQKIKGNKI